MKRTYSETGMGTYGSSKKSKALNNNIAPLKIPKGAKTKIDKQQNQVIKKIWSTLKPEVKVYRNTFSTTLTNAKYILNFADLLQQGITQAQRIGDKVKITSIFIRLMFDTNDLCSDYVRVMLVRPQEGKSALVTADMPNVFQPPDVDIYHTYQDDILTASYNEIGAGSSLYLSEPMAWERTLTFTNGINATWNTGGTLIKTGPALFLVSRSSTSSWSVNGSYTISFTDI